MVIRPFTRSASAALLQNANHVMAHDAGLRVRRDDRAAESLDEQSPNSAASTCWPAGPLAACRSCRSSQATSPRRSARAACNTRRRQRAGTAVRRAAPRPCRALRILGRAVRDESARRDRRAGRQQVAEPRLIRAVVGDALQRRQQRDGGVAVAGEQQRFGLVQHRLIEARAAAARLIDDVGRDAFAHEVRIPALAPSGVDSSAAPVCVEPCTMMTGQPGARGAPESGTARTSGRS